MDRICPECRTRTPERACPADGFATVPAAHVERAARGDQLIGQVFGGRYRVEALLGQGGMGAVYRATQLAMKRPVALKVLRPELAGSLDQARRFQIEARAVSVLTHPNSIRIFDFGQSDDGLLYLVTELLAGESLGSLLRREGALAPDRAVRIAAQALKALAEAHDKGIVHRDLKPDNVFLTRVHGEDDFVKVLDFGIAKVARDGLTGGGLTQTGAVIGTPAYMAPEQAQGTAVDARTDVYAMGTMVYEMLSGAPPFGSTESPMAMVLAQILTPAPPLCAPSGRGLPPALVQVVERALAKDPAERPPDADTLRRLLLDAVAPPTVPEALSAAPETTMILPASVRAATAVVARADVTMRREPPPTGSAPTLAHVPQGAVETTEAPATEPRPPRRGLWIGAAAAGLVAVVAVFLAVQSASPEPDPTEGTRGMSGDASATPPVAGAASSRAVVGVRRQPRGPEGAPASQPSRSLEVETSAPQVAPPPPPPPPAPEVLAALESVPSEAEVTRDGGHVGTTPTKVTLPKDGSPATFVLSKPGYARREVTLSAKEAASPAVVHLKRLRAPRSEVLVVRPR